MRRALASRATVLPVLAAALLASCGGSGSAGNGSTRGGDAGMMGGPGGMMGSGAGTTPAQSPTATSAPGTAATAGAALFRSAGCGSCHALAAAGTTGSIGPDLDQVHPLYEVVVERITSGGDGMPSFAGSLSAAQIRTLARYVASAAR